jgi:hypothetical protein
VSWQEKRVTATVIWSPPSPALDHHSLAQDIFLEFLSTLCDIMTRRMEAVVKNHEDMTTNYSLFYVPYCRVHAWIIQWRKSHLWHCFLFSVISGFFFYICWKDIPRFFCKALNTGKYQLVFKVISQLYLIVLKYVILGERVRLQYWGPLWYYRKPKFRLNSGESSSNICWGHLPPSVHLDSRYKKIYTVTYGTIWYWTKEPYFIPILY